MAKISVETKETFNVTLTEKTIKELMVAIEKAKEDPNVHHIESVDVESHYSNVKFIIIPEFTPQTQESMGYKTKNLNYKSENIG